MLTEFPFKDVFQRDEMTAILFKVLISIGRLQMQKAF
jgi:hypothetical protein